MEKVNRSIIRRMIIQEAKAIQIEKEKLRNNNLKFLKECALKENRLIGMGYGRVDVKNKILKEFVFDAGKDTLKQTVISFIASQLGIDIDSFLGAVIVNTIENITYEEFSDFISGEGDRCELVLENLSAGIIEAIGEQIMESFTGVGQSETGMLSSVVQEMINNFFSERGSVMIKDALRGIVCDFSFGDIFSFATSGSPSSYAKSPGGESSSFDFTNPMKAFRSIGSFLDFDE